MACSSFLFCFARLYSLTQYAQLLRMSSEFVNDNEIGLLSWPIRSSNGLLTGATARAAFTGNSQPRYARYLAPNSDRSAGFVTFTAEAISGPWCVGEVLYGNLDQGIPLRLHFAEYEIKATVLT